VSYSNSSSIAGHAYKRIIRKIAYAAVGYALVSAQSPLGRERFIHGTYFAFYYNGAEAIFAADSRAYVDRQLSNEYCKVIPLSPSRMFAGLGVVAANGNNAFNSDEIARSVGKRMGNDAATLDIVGAWETEVIDALDKASLSRRDVLVNFQQHIGDITTGVFASKEIDSVVMYKDTIKIINTNEDKLRFIGSVERIAPHPDIPFWTFGMDALFLEFMRDTSERAHKANEALQFNPATGIAADAAKLEAVVKFVIKWSGDTYVGGTVPVLILDRDGIKWFHRPNFCPEE
jgi:hypothetical protein